MNIFNKIFNYLKSNNEIEMYKLFSIIVPELDYNIGNVDTKETVLFFFERTKRLNSCPEVFPLIEETKWLGMYGWLHLGIYKEKVIAFGEDGCFYPFCRSIQDLPLQIFSDNSLSWSYKDVKPNEKIGIEMTIDYQRNIDLGINNYFTLLSNYLDFTKNNDIPLDPEYFNEDGELKMFYHPFEIEYDYAEFGIEHLKDKEFLNFD